MPTLLDVLQRRKRAREFTEGFRERAAPEEREFYDQFYQEPTASAVFARGELGSQIDEVEALKRQLMARGMNNLQAGDRARRELAQEEAEFGRSKGLYQQAHPDEGPGTSDELSYQRYAEDYAPYTQTDDQGVETVMTGDPMSEEDFLNRQIARQRLAGDTSAAAKARYESETVDTRIDILEKQAEILPAELEARGASAELTIDFVTELRRLLEIAKSNTRGSDAYNNAIAEAQDLQSLVKGRSGGTGLTSYGPQEHIDSEEEVRIRDGIARSQAATQGDELNVIDPDTGRASKYGPGPRSYGTERTEGDYGQGY
jgi:hypothetical protein